MSRSWQNHVVLITGASSGIGAALGRVLAARGATVALLARRRERLDELVAVIAADGGTARAVACDVTDAAELVRAVDATVDEFGALDMLVCNAGVGTHGSIVHTPLAEYERMFKVNVVGAVAAIQAALPHLIESARVRRGSAGGGGRIGVTSSVMGKFVMPKHGSYGASKFAVQAVADTLRLELDGTGVSVTTICPGETTTEFGAAMLTPEGDLSPAYLKDRAGVAMTPDRVARKFECALWRRRREVTVWYGRLLGSWYTRWWLRWWFERFQRNYARKMGLLPVDYGPSAAGKAANGEAPDAARPQDAS